MLQKFLLVQSCREFDHSLTAVAIGTIILRQCDRRFFHMNKIIATQMNTGINIQ